MTIGSDSAPEVRWPLATARWPEAVTHLLSLGRLDDIDGLEKMLGSRLGRHLRL